MDRENLLESMEFSQNSTGQLFNFKNVVGRIPTVGEIEQTFLKNEGCSTSDVTHSFNHLELSKKKKTRRKPRTKKTSSEERNLATEEIDYRQNPLLALLSTFKIRAITSQTTGKVFRIKNGTLCKHINTKFLIYKTRIDDLPSTSNNLPTAEYDSNYGKAVVKIKAGTKYADVNTAPTDNLKLQPISADLQQAHSLGSSPNQKKKEKKLKKFLPYWSSRKVEEGFEKKVLVEGTIRINPKQFRQAYVNNKDRSEQDYLIPTVVDRNRALEGDIVAIKVKSENEWTDKNKTAYVVAILEKVHRRTVVGSLQLAPDKNKKFAVLIPRDFRLPKIYIPMHFCPSSFFQHPNRFENILFRGKIMFWNDVKYATGTIIDEVGTVGDLESENSAVLIENGLDVTPIPANFMEFTRVSDCIPPKEYSYRKDLREECIFTIDPLTARDLDDAVSCKELENGNFEVGVHISDVAYYLLEDTLLDNVVCKRATTIYVVNNAYHMLPTELCLHCSLLPGCDKLAFSVFWEMTRTGEIISHYFTRSVINSCVQLAYEHAQKMIENPQHEFAEDELPQIHGGFTYRDLSRVVNRLQSIAVNLRRGRFEKGALRIDQTKVMFRLDQVTGEPTEYFVYENKEAHRLIEEFMLLANITVAQRVVKDYPDLAFLRRHDPPNPRLLNDVQKKLEEYDIEFDISSSKTIQTSMSNLEGKSNFDEPQLMVLNHLLAKPMTRALYFCAANAASEAYYEHYALHVPIYTHFTSPIRRYADIMVHRLLAASLRYTDRPKWSVQYVKGIANNCNKQKYHAKIAGEVSSELYLAYYVGEHQPFVQDAVVVEVRKAFFDVMVIATGTVLRIYVNNTDDIECTTEEDEVTKTLIVTFPETSDLLAEQYVIRLFSIVKVSLHRKSKSCKLEAKLLRPLSSPVFQRSSNL